MFVNNLSQAQIDNVRKLIDVLNSGEYKQTKKTLREEDHNTYNYCCLGVACDLVKDSELNWKDNKFGKLNSNFDELLLVTDVVAKYGLTDNAGKLTKSGINFILSDCPPHIKEYVKFQIEQGLSIYLTILNDELDFTFTQIATVIKFELENNLSNQFKN